MSNRTTHARAASTGYALKQTQGAANAPLSNLQKQKLAAMAHYAYVEMAPDESFDDWRRAEVRRAVGKDGLRQCSNGDFNPLKARWLEMTGKIDAAFAAAMRAVNEPKQWAMFNLMKICTESKDVMPEAMKYARGFIRNKRHVELEDADDKTIWHAVYTVKSKAIAERKKLKGGASAGDILGNLLGRATMQAKPAAKPARTSRAATVEGPF